MWQGLETKQRFINQIMTGDCSVRRAEDISGEALSYAEVKAIASGNPAVLTLAEADAEIQRLSVLKRNHADEQFLARRKLRDLPAAIEHLSQRLAGLTADKDTAAAHAGDPITLGQRTLLRDDVLTGLGACLDGLPLHVQETRRVPLGVYRGLCFGLLLHPLGPPDVYLEGKATRQSQLSRDHHGPRAVLNGLERLAGGYRFECERVHQDLAMAESQLRDYRARLGQPFAYDPYLSQLTALRDQLKAGLAGVSPETAIEAVPVAELAERIKTLKAAHSIEATPERTAPRRTSAEEPVTARIRRRERIPSPADGEWQRKLAQEKANAGRVLEPG